MADLVIKRKKNKFSLSSGIIELENKKGELVEVEFVLDKVTGLELNKVFKELSEADFISHFFTIFKQEILKCDTSEFYDDELFNGFENWCESADIDGKK